MTTTVILALNGNPVSADVECAICAGLEGKLCRGTGSDNIVTAIKAGAATMRGASK